MYIFLRLHKQSLPLCRLRQEREIFSSARTRRPYMVFPSPPLPSSLSDIYKWDRGRPPIPRPPLANTASGAVTTILLPLLLLPPAPLLCQRVVSTTLDKERTGKRRRRKEGLFHLLPGSPPPPQHFWDSRGLFRAATFSSRTNERGSPLLGDKKKL